MSSAWPLFELRLRTPRLELRSPTDDDVFALLEVARGGVHDAAHLPFAVAWTDLASPAFERGFLQFYWGCRASWTPEAWQLPMAVVLNDRPIGVQDLSATGFPTLRTVMTGSWPPADKPPANTPTRVGYPHKARSTHGCTYRRPQPV